MASRKNLKFGLHTGFLIYFRFSETFFLAFLAFEFLPLKMILL